MPTSQHLAFRNHVGGVGEHLHDAHVVHPDHHLEGARIEEIADQHRCGIAEHRVGGLVAAAQFGLIHHVIVEQRRGVDEFHHGRQLMVIRAAVPHCTGGVQHQRGSQALAAAVNDVLRHLTDQYHVRMKTLANDRVDRLHVGCDRREELLDGQGGRAHGEKAAW
jgi:hypothetical protein